MIQDQGYTPPQGMIQAKSLAGRGAQHRARRTPASWMFPFIWVDLLRGLGDFPAHALSAVRLIAMGLVQIVIRCLASASLIGRGLRKEDIVS